ncbi:MAG TPA: hydrogenase expression/formation protein HypE [Vicinamibacteria bacterium]|nr:hydrogenase expression/formation protein HypE [Vicinamibacteria bacterium]
MSDTTLGSCPIPFSRYGHITLGHGSGGELMADLISGLFVPAFANETLAALEDQASLAWNGSRLAFTTDSYVVRPLFFPGGDIGSLAVNGTINDLSVGGATPIALSAAFILEEGLEIALLERIVRSMARACSDAGVELVTGDTKVVERGKGDQVFINTSGIGRIAPGSVLSIASAQPGDRILVSGTLGDHGIAILSVREGLAFETTIKSDSAPLHTLTRAMLDTCPQIRCMRDLTRGGLSSALHELAAASDVGVRLFERDIPLKTEVRAASEMLGLDPVYIANEGKLMAIVPEAHSKRVIGVMRSHPLGADAADIGEIAKDQRRRVVMQSSVGGERVVTRISGEPLPRIC